MPQEADSPLSVPEPSMESPRRPGRLTFFVLCATEGNQVHVVLPGPRAPPNGLLPFLHITI